MKGEHAPHRRIEFDSIVEGWGADDAANLVVRLELVAIFEREYGELTPAERKIATAMQGHLARLGGLENAQAH